MTIKEIEELAEMPRANIRFYEAEGLLSPARNVNGYRDYSQEDLLVLRKIKLLRSLHMSLEDIKALHAGKQELSVVLEQQINKLSADKENLQKAQAVCEIMYRDGLRYENLDAEKYLSDLKKINTNLTRPDTEKYSWETYWDSREAYEDTLPKIKAPWRRFFARTLDEALYSVIWSCFLVLAMGVNLAKRNSVGANLLDILMMLLLNMVLEPLQLSLFGTTLGKWIFGIRVLHNDERKLDFSEAFERTLTVFFYGLGLHIPIYTLYRLWKSYKACTDGEGLEWEDVSRITLKDERPFRVLVYAAVRVLFVGAVAFVSMLGQIPPHRGNLTIPQFAQNYRHLTNYYGMETGYTLNIDGEWKSSFPEGSVVINLSALEGPPAFVFETDDHGFIQKIHFTVNHHVPKDTPEDDRKWMSNFQTQMQMASLAFVGAREEFPQFSTARKKMLKTISSHTFSDYSFTWADVTVTCDVEQQGYSAAGANFLIPADEGECSFYLQFSMIVKTPE
ncbi:MAG: MerR family transcriptional regulator [Lachnospiraceae bacterium]|nr:MerR family transcriptional regulator [Lachnospiraceae bacterium]